MKENRSLFFPLLLIASGVTWLMISMGRLDSSNLWALTHIWPFVLIALGAGLILRGFWRPFGMLVSALVVIGAFLAVFYAPQLGWNDGPNFNLESGVFGGVPGSGVVKTEKRDVESFDSISIRYPAEVTVTQGKVESLSIESDDNVLPQIRTKVVDGVLVIENTEEGYSKRVTPTQSIRITIVVKDLRKVDFSSAGTLSVSGLKTDSFELNLSGAGEVTFSKVDFTHMTVRLSGAGSISADGTVDVLDATISGAGNIEAEGLAVSKATVRISGLGSATVRVEDELSAHISGAGSIDYYGDPQVEESISGAGSINKAGE